MLQSESECTGEPRSSSPSPLRPAAAAARLGVSVRSLAEWANAGYIPAFTTAGGHRRYRVEDLDAVAGNRR